MLIAADALPRMFPMLMTAAGTVAPARVLVIGAGVAGLQAIATARRLGAVVSGYDIRAAVKEQIESLGARFVVLELENAGAEDKGGYAKAMGEDFYRRQREALGGVLAEQNVVITTAAVPGRKAPILITREMVGAHGARIGDRRYRRRARRQLRTDAARRGGRAQRRPHPRPAEPAVHDSLSRQPDVRQEHRDVSEVPDQGRQARAESRGRDRARNAGDARGRSGRIRACGNCCTRSAINVRARPRTRTLRFHAGDLRRPGGDPQGLAAAAHAADVADQRDLGDLGGRRDPDHRRGRSHAR